MDSTSTSSIKNDFSKLGQLQGSSSTVPEFVRPFLWDVDLAKLDLNKHQQFIIERILEYGGDLAYAWLKTTYSIDDIVQALKKSRRLSHKTANYFSLLYQVNPQEVKCLQQPFTQKQNRF